MDRILEYLQSVGPERLMNLLMAIGILVVGWLVALVVAMVVRLSLKRTEIDNRLAAWLVGEEKANGLPIERWVARAVFWILMLFVVIGFFQVLGLTVITEPLNRFLIEIFEYLPNLIGPAILVLVAWFVATAFPEKLENPVKVLAGGKLSEIVLPRRDPSLPVRIPSDGIMRIVREIENPDDPDKPAYQTLAQALIPEGVQKALLILVPASPKEAPLLYQTKVQDLAGFKGGDYLFLNLTTARVAVEMGKTKLGLEPGKSRIFEAPTLREPENTPISYHYYQPEDDEWVLLSASTVVLQPTRREICVFSWDPRYKRIDYHGITVPVVR